MLGAQPPDELVQAAERAVEAVGAKAQELRMLQQEGDASPAVQEGDASPPVPSPAVPSPAVAACAQELEKAELAAKEAADALESAAKALQQQRVAACASALLELIAPYVELCLEHSSGRADRTDERAAYRGEVEAVYERLRDEPMGEPILRTLGYAYSREAIKQVQALSGGVFGAVGSWLEGLVEGTQRLGGGLATVGSAVSVAHAVSGSRMAVGRRAEGGGPSLPNQGRPSPAAAIQNPPPPSPVCS